MRRTSNTDEPSGTLTWATPLLFLLCTLLLLVTAWSPWGVARIHYGTEVYYSSKLSGNEVLWRTLDAHGFLSPDESPLVPLLWEALPLVGLLIVAWYLIGRPGRAGAWLTVLWMFLLSAAFGVALYGQFSLHRTSAVPGLLQTTESQPAVGTWLAIIGLPLTWLVVVLLLRQSGDVSREQRTSFTSHLPHRTARSLFTIGVLAWAFGLVAMPWALASCTPPQHTVFPFAVGQCYGIFEYNALDYGINSYLLHAQSGASWPFAEHIWALLITGALLALILWWRSGRAIATLLVSAIWLFAAAGCAALATLGAIHVLRRPLQAVSAHPGAWTFGQGAWVAGLGMALCAFAIIAYLVTTLTRRSSPVEVAG